MKVFQKVYGKMELEEKLLGMQKMSIGVQVFNDMQFL